MEEHWKEITELVVAFSALLSGLNKLIPADKGPKWLHWILDRSAWLAKKGMRGKQGHHMKMPLTKSRRVLTPPSPPAAAASLVFFFASQAAGCYCWQAEHKDEKQCIVAHQTVNCLTDVSGLKVLESFIVKLLSGGNADWNIVEQAVISLGFKDAGCIISQLESDFAAHPENFPPDMKTKWTFLANRWKEQNEATALTFKVRK